MQRLAVADSFSENADVVLHTGSAEDFISTLPDNSIRLIVTSPPYNLGKEYEKTTSIEKYIEKMTDTISDMDIKLMQGGSICWQVGNYVKDGEVFPLDTYYYFAFKNLGYKLRNRIIWHYGHGLHAQVRFSGRYETILWFTKGDEYVFNLDPVRIPSKYPGKRHYRGKNKGKPSGNPKGKNPSDVWEMLSEEWHNGFWNIPNVKARHIEKTSHPCQFPVALVERCVLALTNEGDVVFDPFAGVGSSLIAAVKHNRKAVGCEKEQSYVDIAHERIEQYQAGKLKLRPLGKPVYEPKPNEKVAQIPEEWLDEDHKND
ncbi:MAG: site-specific DNA-methyltransferase [Anaerolineae bacterium]